MTNLTVLLVIGIVSCTFLVEFTRALHIDFRSFRTDDKPEEINFIRHRQSVCAVAADDVPPCSLIVHDHIESIHRHPRDITLEDNDQASAELKVEVTSPAIIEKFRIEDVECASIKSSEDTNEKSLNLNLKTPEIIHRSPRQVNTPIIDILPRFPIYSSRPQIITTKVVDSPVTATLIAVNCFPDTRIPRCPGNGKEIQFDVLDIMAGIETSAKKSAMNPSMNVMDDDEMTKNTSAHERSESSSEELEIPTQSNNIEKVSKKVNPVIPGSDEESTTTQMNSSSSMTIDDIVTEIGSDDSGMKDTAQIAEILTLQLQPTVYSFDVKDATELDNETTTEQSQITTFNSNVEDTRDLYDETTTEQQQTTTFTPIVGEARDNSDETTTDQSQTTTYTTNAEETRNMSDETTTEQQQTTTFTSIEDDARDNSDEITTEQPQTTTSTSIVRNARDVSAIEPQETTTYTTNTEDTRDLYDETTTEQQQTTTFTSILGDARNNSDETTTDQSEITTFTSNVEDASDLSDETTTEPSRTTTFTSTAGDARDNSDETTTEQTQTTTFTANVEDTRDLSDETTTEQPQPTTSSRS